MRPKKTVDRARGSGAAASESALLFLPAEVREQAGSDIDEWGRVRRHQGPDSDQEPELQLRGAQAHAARNTGAASDNLRRDSARKGHRRRMISFDIAEVYPQCRGWNITFTGPLKPTPSELNASWTAVCRQMLQHVAAMPPQEVWQRAHDACAEGAAEELIEKGLIPECVKLAFDPEVDAMLARVSSKLSSSNGRAGSMSSAGAVREEDPSGDSSDACLTRWF